MIAVSALDTNEHLVLHEAVESSLRDNAARVSRYATLDGGVVIVHQGVSDGDRTLTVRGTVTSDDEAVLEGLFRDHTRVHISTPDGFFVGAIARLATDHGDLLMSLYIESKLSE